MWQGEMETGQGSRFLGPSHADSRSQPVSLPGMRWGWGRQDPSTPGVPEEKESPRKKGQGCSGPAVSLLCGLGQVLCSLMSPSFLTTI